MTKHILGIGGIFFKSNDPEKLKQWYIDNLGLEPDEEGYILFKWHSTEESKHKAYTVWAPFKKDTTYFEPSKKPFMINFCVRDIEGLVKKLNDNGVPVDDKIEEIPEGKFAWFMDPEGNRVELWEPPRM